MEVKSEKKGYSVNPSDYQLLEEVGQGVSALVYRALCIPCNEIVAIKSLDLERCNSNLDDIRREAQTMSLINHPNVVKAYCSFVVEHSLWVVMPYMAGGSCLHIMKAAYPDGFEEPIIATFLKESLKALEYLHYHGHIHRDVKAGNILVDASGAVKLGDFGVSACMFDTGDRQRSRNTFVGTPCWMAPEVLEQVHGYDFKADIWSFGITALELAHGHAPFSKYPPMKVLLMTLQNAPPGLDYERDKRFSKSFKEMIAMCLVKDPAKRPTAEKLLKHSFFKQARSADYIARTILGHLAPLWERVKELKKKDATRLAQKKMPYGEQEERSQNEYKRGVSCWNFDVEDLKAQAALDDAYPIAGKEEPDTLKPSGLKDNDIAVEIPQSQASALLANVTHDLDAYQMPVTIHSLKAETATDAGERVTRVRSGPLPTPVSSKASNNSKSASVLTGKKEPKHIGRFDVFEDDPDLDNSEWRCSSKNIQQHKIEEKDPVQEEKKGQSKVDRDNGTGDEKEHKGEKELKWSEDRVREQEECRRTLSGPLLAERVVGSSRSLDDEREQDRDSRSSTSRALEDLVRPTQQPKERAYSGPLTSSGVPLDNRPANGHKEASDEKLKGPVVQKKGRFSVTHDVDLAEGASSASSTRKNASVQTSLLHKSASVGDWLSEKKGPSPAPTSQPLPASSMVSAGLNASALISQLQNLFTQTTVQQDLIVNLMAHINPSENSNVQRSSNPSSKNASRSTSMSLVDSVVEVSTERERELLSQVADLQCRIAILVDELQAVKLRNVQLERQLNAIYNKEEEERIRREEAAREDG